jgi:hypothetical protein
MKTVTHKILTVSAGLLLASAVHTFAIEGLQVSVQCSNVVLSWPSADGETYIVQYRQTLDPSDSWQTLTNYFPNTSGTNVTAYIHSNVVQNPCNCGGSSFAAMSSSQNTLALAAAEPFVPMAIPTNGAGGAVPLALYPPGFDLSGFLILDPFTGESVSGSEYSASPLVLSSPQFDGPQPLDGGSGSGGTSPAPETGFYRAVRNGVHIYGLTNGMTLSGLVSFPLEMALDSTNEIASVTFYDGDSPLIGSSAHTTAGGGWVLDWNTPMTLNGNHSIYAEVDFVTDDPVTNVPVTVTVSNVISFPNYFSRVFGDWMWLYAETVPNTAYEIDLYDENTNSLGYFADYTDGSGIISFIWDLTDGNGHTFDSTNFYGVFTVDASSLNVQSKAQASGVGARPSGFQTLSPSPKALNSRVQGGALRSNDAGSSSSANQTWAKEAKWPYNNNNYVVAYGPFDNGYAAYRQNMAMLGGEGGEYGGVIHTLNPYNLNNNLSPGNSDQSTAFALSDATAKTNLLSYFGDIRYRNCYFWGHGSPSAIGSINPASTINVYDIQKAVGNFLNTAKPQNFHPYRFVFLDGCSTGKGNFCETFGIPAQTVNNQFFANVGVESRAFLGFKTVKNFEPTKWTWYAIMIGGFYEDWLANTRLDQCVANAVNGTHNYGEVMMSSSWVIYGAPDLQRGTITRP